MQKHGFTLVELLAVIAILAILAIISLPNVLQMVNDARMNSFDIGSKSIIKASEQQLVSGINNLNSLQTIIYYKNISCKAPNCYNSLEIENNNSHYALEVNKNGDIINFYSYDYDFVTYIENSKMKTVTRAEYCQDENKYFGVKINEDGVFDTFCVLR